MNEVARQFGLHRTTVRAILDRAGVAVHPREMNRDQWLQARGGVKSTAPVEGLKVTVGAGTLFSRSHLRAFGAA